MKPHSGGNENPYLTRKLEAIEVKTPKTISQLLSEMSKTGFQGRKLGEAIETWLEMLRSRDLTIIMGLAGSMSTTGQWKIIKWLIERRYIDVLISTGANISEDIQDSLHGYYQGHWLVNDEELFKYGVFRYYDVFTDGLKYRKITELIREFINTLRDNYPYSSREFCMLFGKFLYERNIDSILATAYKHKVPVFSPAIVDSEYGIAAVLSRRIDKRNIIVDQMKDFDELTEIGLRNNETGVIYIGGGVPKDFAQLLTAIIGILKGGKLEYPHKYAIQITTDAPHWGGLSGATFEEAISWGKEAKSGRNTQCYCDATIALPIIAQVLAERIDRRENYPDFSWLFI
ncbi:MAG: deoxyhypusine synthase [Candidatus Methanomethylicia archaeon]